MCVPVSTITAELKRIPEKAKRPGSGSAGSYLQHTPLQPPPHDKQNLMSASLPLALLSPYSVLLLWGIKGEVLSVKWMCNHNLSFKVITHTSWLFFMATMTLMSGNDNGQVC